MTEIEATILKNDKRRPENAASFFRWKSWRRCVYWNAKCPAERAVFPSTELRNPSTVSKPSPERVVYERAYVQTLFDAIAFRYDLLNHMLSFGLDILWRTKTIRLLKASSPKNILDVATGTGDFAISAAALRPDRIVGIDISANMLQRGQKKIQALKLDALISLEEGAAEQLRFEPETFDAVTCAFGVRNFHNLRGGLSEMYRVLKPGGALAVLEFSQPRIAPIRQLYKFYSHRCLPLVGGLISRSREAYRYLPSTVSEFPDGGEFLDYLNSAGFINAEQFSMTWGIVTAYRGFKPEAR